MEPRNEHRTYNGEQQHRGTECSTDFHAGGVQVKEMAVYRPTAVSNWENRELIETLKQTVCKGASDAQFMMFSQVCQATGLNPWLREIGRAHV